MVVTRNQSRFTRYPAGAGISGQWKEALGEKVGDINAIGNNLKRVAKGGDGVMRTPKKRCRPSLAQDSILATFLADTSIHGVKYITQENRHWSERLFWVVAFLLGVLSSAYLIHQMWDRYQTTPVIVTFDTNEVDISSIPFPAVTICNANMVSKRLVEQLKLTLKQTDTSDPKHLDAEEKLGFVRHVCDESQNISSDSVDRFAHGKRPQDFIQFLINYADPCDEMIKFCVFNKAFVPCASAFTPIITVFGKCCSFNLLPLDLLFKMPNKTSRKVDNSNREPGDEFVEDKYFTTPIGVGHWSEWQPKKQKRAAIVSGLSFVIDAKLDDYYCATTFHEGLNIEIHSPHEMPDMRTSSSLVLLGKNTYFNVYPDITKADPDIRNYSQEKRKCYFENEAQLNYHGPYTTRGCIIECVTAYLAKTCGCTTLGVSNYYPEHMVQRICTSGDFPCLLKAEVNVDSDLDVICPGCDPLCEDIKYSYQMSIGNLMSSNKFWKHPMPGFETDNRRHTTAVVSVYLGSQKTVPKLRKALYGWTDLIANTGGILGLCLGFSVISGIELLYFFTLRTCCIKRGRGITREERRSVAGAMTDIVRSRSRVINLLPARFAEEGMTKVG